MINLKGLTKAVPLLWFDHVTIMGSIVVKDGSYTDTKSTTIIANEPAKISRRYLKPSNQSYFGTDEYDVVMYIRQGIKIPAGCDVYVRDINGQTTKYKQSGKAYTGYVSHQEVALIRDEKAKAVISDGLGET